MAVNALCLTFPGQPLPLLEAKNLKPDFSDLLPVPGPSSLEAVTGLSLQDPKFKLL